ncbi:calphotin-like [Schistocerca serialis cubense]|uniref:calphotin-like n=1 Tax=Schistocerca serialis cubense TaxID=2023355 RepID=UPI00214F44C6|nr:calphotin-like [Schistocerca serialis cubense]
MYILRDNFWSHDDPQDQQHTQMVVDRPDLYLGVDDGDHEYVPSVTSRHIRTVVVLAACAVARAGVVPAAPVVAAAPAAALAYSRAVPYNVPPYAAAVNVQTRALAAPLVAAAAPIAAPLAAAPVAAPLAAAPVAAPLAAAPFAYAAPAALSVHPPAFARYAAPFLI